MAASAAEPRNKNSWAAPKGAMPVVSPDARALREDENDRREEPKRSASAARRSHAQSVAPARAAKRAKCFYSAGGKRHARRFSTQTEMLRQSCRPGSRIYSCCPRVLAEGESACELSAGRREFLSAATASGTDSLRSLAKLMSKVKESSIARRGCCMFQVQLR